MYSVTRVKKTVVIGLIAVTNCVLLRSVWAVPDPSTLPSGTQAVSATIFPVGAGAILNQVTGQLGQARQVVSTTASDLMSTAMGFLGVPYVRGGTDINGLDCSGFVVALYKQSLGLVLPRTAAEQASSTKSIDVADLQPGDLVFFNTMRRAFSHVGVYIGDGKFIHAPRTGAQVRVDDMERNYWQTRFNGARRVAVNGMAEKP